jgi:hypothetical protein
MQAEGDDPNASHNPNAVNVDSSQNSLQSEESHRDPLVMQIIVRRDLLNVSNPFEVFGVSFHVILYFICWEILLCICITCFLSSMCSRDWQVGYLDMSFLLSSIVIHLLMLGLFIYSCYAGRRMGLRPTHVADRACRGCCESTVFIEQTPLNAKSLRNNETNPGLT